MPPIQATHIRSWLTDGPFRRLLQNAGILLSGNVAASAITLAAVALTARALGPKQFGVLMLFQAYAFVVHQLVNFQSWQGLIKYGAGTLERTQHHEFKQLIKFGTLLDASTAVLGAMLAVSGAFWVGRWQGWDPAIVRMATFYSLVISFNLSSTPTAVLRLFHRFNRFAIRDVATAGLKLTGVILACVAGGGLRAFVAIWMLAEIVGQILLLSMGWIALYRAGFRGIFRVPMRGLTHAFGGLWKFVLTTNVTTSVTLATRELDTLIVGGILGAAAAGLYRVARQCANSIDQLTDPLYYAVYPELALSWSRGDTARMRRLVLGSGVVAAGAAAAVWLTFVLLGRPFLRLAFGADFLDAYGVLVWCVFGAVIDVAALSLPPTLWAVGRPGWDFWVNAGSLALYLPLLVVLMRAVGLTGAGMAYVVYFLSRVLVTGSIVWRLLHQRATHPVVTAAGVTPAGNPVH